MQTTRMRRLQPSTTAEKFNSPVSNSFNVFPCITPDILAQLSHFTQYLTLSMKFIMQLFILPVQTSRDQGYQTRQHGADVVLTSWTMRLLAVTFWSCAVFLSFIWCSSDESHTALSVSDLAMTITLPCLWKMRNVCSWAILFVTSLGSKASCRASKLKLDYSRQRWRWRRRQSMQGGNVEGQVKTSMYRYKIGTNAANRLSGHETAVHVIRQFR